MPYALIIGLWILATILFMVLYFAYGLTPIALMRLAIEGEMPVLRRWSRVDVADKIPVHSPLDNSIGDKAIEQQRVKNPERILYHMPIEERGHVIIAGRQGDGKTQTSITLMISDITRSAQIYWLNPHATLYHPKDQRTDLHPLKAYFTTVYAYDEIVATLAQAYTLVHTVRLPLYREGKDVGHPIVLYIDEWPAIVDGTAGEAVRYVQLLLRESRKCNVWLVFATQDAQIETLKLKSGVRAAFNTRLVGTVDDATWLALCGKGVARPQLGWGRWWMSRSDGAQLIMWQPFPSALVKGLVERLTPPVYPSLSEVSTILPKDSSSEPDTALLEPWKRGITPIESSSSVPAQEVTSVVTAPVTALEEGNETFIPQTSQTMMVEFVSNEGKTVVISPFEMAFIGQLLTSASPSEAAKKLPGYTPTEYKVYKAKVDYVRSLLVKS